MSDVFISYTRPELALVEPIRNKLVGLRLHCFFDTENLDSGDLWARKIDKEDTVEHLGERGIGLRSLTEAIDSNTSGGRLVFHIFGALSEFERGVIRERTMAGLENARRLGRKGGRPRAMSADDIAAARVLLTSPDITVEAVAERMGVSPATLYRYFPGGRSAV